MKLDLGAGAVKGRDGWTTLDLLPGADVHADLRVWKPHVAPVEVAMIHVLEHFPRAETLQILRHVHSYMQPGGRLTVEVPDMAGIMRFGVSRPTWEQDIYGAQSSRGEFHQAGFTPQTLFAAIDAAGFRPPGRAEAFLSDLPIRPGMPCVRVEATA